MDAKKFQVIFYIFLITKTKHVCTTLSVYTMNKHDENKISQLNAWESSIKTGLRHCIR
jgi:hypothetical protein